MDKKQQQILIKSWKIQNNILQEIGELAHMNTMLAYGVIRQAETLIDFISVNNYHRAERAVISKQER